MARIRTIKPEFWTDSKVVQLSPIARLLFIGCWNFADDYGALAADPLQLKLRVLPAEQCDPQDLVDELLDAGLLRPTTNGQDTFWIVAGWEKHQKVDRRSTSTFGDPETWHPTEPSTSPAELRRVPPSPRDGREGKGREGKKPTVGTADADTDDEFESFWASYPRHHDTKALGGGGVKKQAKKAWDRLSQAQRQEVIAALESYAKVCRPDGQKPKHAERFLRNDAWKPYLPDARAGPARSPTCGQCDRPLDDPTHDELCDIWSGKAVV